MKTLVEVKNQVKVVETNNEEMVMSLNNVMDETKNDGSKTTIVIKNQLWEETSVENVFIY